MKIEIKAEKELDTRERSQLELLSAEAFPPDGDPTQWAGGDWHVLVWEAQAIVSHVEIVERTATIDGLPIRLGGIGGVATLKAWRRRGLAEAALKVATDFLHEPLKVDFGLLVCGPIMIPYYARFGWKLLSQPMWIEQPQGRVIYKEPIMILPVGQSEWPQGELDLCGRPW